MAKKHEVLLAVSDQQENAIRKLFCENNWEYTNLCMYFAHNRITLFHIQHSGLLYLCE